MLECKQENGKKDASTFLHDWGDIFYIAVVSDRRNFEEIAHTFGIRINKATQSRRLFNHAWNQDRREQYTAGVRDSEFVSNLTTFLERRSRFVFRLWNQTMVAFIFKRRVLDARNGPVGNAIRVGGSPNKPSDETPCYTGRSSIHTARTTYTLKKKNHIQP